MLVAIVTGERTSIATGGGAAGSPERNPNPNPSNNSNSNINNNNNQDTSYNSGSSNNYSGSGGTLENRVIEVSCAICSGDSYDPNEKLSNGWNCGYLQETVQDVNVNSQWEDERIHCQLAQLEAESGGCCPTKTFSNRVSNINDPCSLCGAGSVPVSKLNILTQTPLGRHSCGGLADAMNSGILSANLCPAVIAQAGSTCCISGRSGSLRGATPDMASDIP